MGERLCFFSHMRPISHRFSSPPYITAVNRVALLGYEYGILADVLLLNMG